MHVGAACAIGMWAVGVPLFYAVLLHAATRESCLTVDRRELRKRLGMLIGDYQGQFIGWEMVAIAHKLTLTGFLALYRPGTVAQIFVACVVGLTIGAVQTLASPYRTPSDNYFAFFTSCMLQLVLLGSLIRQAMTLSQDTLGINPVVKIGLLFLATLLVLLAALYLFAVELHASRHVFETVATRQAPVIELAPSKRWHVFISHRWANQDVAATIKRQLQLLLPGVSVFLDVRTLAPLFSRLR